MNSYANTIQRNSRPLEPIPTDAKSRLHVFPNIKAVLFDIYGTLLVSGSGDVGVAMQMTKAEALQTALDACGVKAEIGADEFQTKFYEAIADEHQRAKNAGTDYPEIVVEQIWQKVFEEAIATGAVTIPREFRAEQFALEFETRVNPVWPMPGLREVLKSLRRQGYTLGIISNAQFFYASSDGILPGIVA